MRTFTLQDINVALEEATDIMYGLFGRFMPVQFRQIKIGHSTSKWASVRYYPEGAWELYVSDVFAQIEDDTIYHDKLVGTLVHELIHTMFPLNEGHGKRFKEAAAVVNRRYPWCQIQRCTSMEAYGIKHNYRKRTGQRNIRYIVTCADCGKVYQYTSKTRWMNPTDIVKCSCGKCRSHNLTYKHVTPAEAAELNRRG